MELSFSQDLDANLYADATPDHAIFDTDFGSEGMKPTFDQIFNSSRSFLADNLGLGSLTELDPDWFSADDVDLDQMAGSSSSFLFAGESGCDLAYFDDAQLLGKVRREAACKVPVGQVKDADDSDKKDPFDFSQFSASVQSLKMFGKFFEICPVYIFGASNTPVCKDETPGDVLRTTGESSVTLLNVLPSTFCIFRMPSQTLVATADSAL